MTAQFQYRRGDNDVLNVLPALGGRSTTSSLTAPVSLNIRHKRSMYNDQLQRRRRPPRKRPISTPGMIDVAGDRRDHRRLDGAVRLGHPGAVVLQPVERSRRDAARPDRSPRSRWPTRWTHPYKQHLMRIGGDVRFDRSSSDTDPNAEGAFVFTGLYTSGGLAGRARRRIRLRRLPARAAAAGLGAVRSGHRHAARTSRRASSSRTTGGMRANLTFNLGVRYELIWPFVEARRTSRQPRCRPGLHRGGAGARRADRSVPRRVSRRAASTPTPTTRAAARRRLADQAGHDPPRRLRHQLQLRLVSDDRAPARRPAAVRDCGHRHRRCTRVPLIVRKRRSSTSTPDRRRTPTASIPTYALGRVQTWNADLSRDLGPNWNVGARLHAHHRLEPRHRARAEPRAVRAADRRRAAVPVADVGGRVGAERRRRSGCSAGSFKGIGGRRRPTRCAKSRDDASTIGGGGTVVAQNDQDLGRRMGALELRPASPAHRRLLGRAAVRRRTNAGCTTAGSGLASSAAGAPRRRSPGCRARRSRRASPVTRRMSRAAPTARCAPTTTARRSSSRIRRSTSSSTPRRSPFRRRARSARRAAT